MSMAASPPNFGRYGLSTLYRICEYCQSILYRAFGKCPNCGAPAKKEK